MNVNAYATLVTSAAPISYSKEGQKIPEGVNCLRLHLSCFDKEGNKESENEIRESRFDITCFEEYPREIESIPIEIGNKKFYLHLDECSKRLHLSKNKINSYTNENCFFKLIQYNEKKLKRLVLIVNHYERLMNYYNEEMNETYLYPKEKVITPSMTKSGLMKIVRLFEKQVETRPKPTYLELSLKRNQLAKYGLAHVFKIVALSPSTAESMLLNKSYKTKLSEGSSSIIYKVHNLSLGNFSILKKAKRYYGSNLEKREKADFSHENMRKEVAILYKLEAKKLSRGIQKPPYFLVEQEELPKIFYYGPYYNQSDLLVCSSHLSIKDRVKYLANNFIQIISALERLHRHHYFHNDIKPENILVNMDDEGKYRLVIGDLGGLRRSSSNTKKFKVDYHTPAYTPYNLRFGMYTVKTLQSVDVFQMGSTLVTSLVNTTPYSRNPTSIDYPQADIPFDETVLSEHCSKEAVDILKQMCELSQAERPTMEQVKALVMAEEFRWEK